MKQQNFWDEIVTLNTYRNPSYNVTMAIFAAKCLPNIFTGDTEEFIDYRALKVDNEPLYSRERNDKIIVALRTFLENFKVKISLNGNIHEATPYIVKYFCEDTTPPSHQGFYIKMVWDLIAYRQIIEKLAIRTFTEWIKTYAQQEDKQ